MSAKLLALTAPGSAVEIFITGNDRAILSKVADNISDELVNLEGLYNINNAAVENKQEYYVDVDNDVGDAHGPHKI